MAEIGRTSRQDGRAAKAEAFGQAVRALEQGGVVVVPSETAYIACAAVGEPGSDRGLQSIKALARAFGWKESDPHPVAVWLSPTIQRVGQALLGPGNGVRRRLLSRLAPGPTVFLIELPPAEHESARTAIGVGAGIVDAGGWFGVRVSGNDAAAALAARSASSVACMEVPASQRVSKFEASGSVDPARDALTARAAVENAGVADAYVLDEGLVTLRAGTTVLELPLPTPDQVSGPRGSDADADFRVLKEGAYERRFIEKQLMQTMLFVCSGNTCRSPMAEAIAVGQIARDRALKSRVRVASAGTGAGPGQPAAPEAIRAVASLGYALDRHASRPLTRRLIAEADVIYAMTGSHVAAIKELDPGAADKVQTLDPLGQDVPDPIGLGQEVYTQTARRVEELVRLRLKELGS